MAQQRDAPLLEVGDLVGRYGLPEAAGQQLEELAHLLSTDPLAPTAVRGARRVLEDHLADSLVALELQCVRAAATAVDIGSGAGLPGLPLAIALPGCSFVLLESSGRKCSFMRRAVAACSLSNVDVVNARAEAWEPGLGRFDLAVVRAVGRLDAVLEYAAPLLKVGGDLVVWRGRRDPEAEVEAERTGEILEMQAKGVREVAPYPGARHRHLHLFSKVRDTPRGFPRRAGLAAKRPLGRSRGPTAG